MRPTAASFPVLLSPQRVMAELRETSDRPYPVWPGPEIKNPINGCAESSAVSGASAPASGDGASAAEKPP